MRKSILSTNHGTLEWLEAGLRDASIDLVVKQSPHRRPGVWIKWPDGKQECFFLFNPLGKPEYRFLIYEQFYKFDKDFGIKQNLTREAIARLRQIADAWCAEENAEIDRLTDARDHE